MELPDRHQVELMLQVAAGGKIPVTGDTIVRLNNRWTFRRSGLTEFTVENYTPTYTLDASTAGLPEIINFVCTLIAEMQS